ncbi:ATP-binding cassette domain-containing protein [Streptomyces sp. MBT27]|uniref:ABC transporter ATP-binding protein n=1 Tax=Streptomyces sp. MBT27 TaxID=1488356 RepID=UPI001420C698|nr:ATP-binding cassette domain-containing protein [Streptomyces sp. MBT27]
MNEKTHRTPAGTVTRAATLVAERVRLLRMVLGANFPALTAALVASHTLTMLWPTISALATGWLAAETAAVLGNTASPAAVVWPLAVLGALLLADEVSAAFRDRIQRLMAGRLDGRALRETRRLVLGARNAELPLTRADDISRASDIGPDARRSPGAAAVGQLTLTFRVLSAVVAAALLARFFPVTAVLLLSASLVARATVRRQWIGLAAVRNAREGEARRIQYWSDISAGRATAKEVRLFALAGFVVRRRTREALSWAGDIWLARRTILVQQWATIGLALASAAIGMAVPGLAALHGELSTGQLVTCLVAVTVVFRISSMGMEAYDIEYGLEAVRALDALRGEADSGPAAQRVAVVAPTAAGTPADIRFEGLGFRYPGSERPVLDGLDLRIRPGETLAIVGDSGAGKTTLIKLLAGLYTPTAGRVTVDGTDLASLDAEAWRCRLGIVFQDFNRYPLSLADNVALGAPEHRGDADGVAQALRRADAANLADGLPAKEATLLSGEFHGGVDLSGGQWQRLALARALFATAHGRDVLVLDEPTAHLDVESEAEFHQRVAAAVEETTVVLISHRLSTVRRADRIVRIADGRVVEEGSHDALMAADGGYARLFRLQAARFGNDPAGAAGVPSPATGHDVTADQDRDIAKATP